MMAQRFYPAVIVQDAGDGPDDGYDVVFADFPGCLSGGDTIQQAAAMAAEALAGHIEAMVRDNDPVPEPSIPVCCRIGSIRLKRSPWRTS
jgi:predicted RNase H-like HicB family nuclease